MPSQITYPASRHRSDRHWLRQVWPYGHRNERGGDADRGGGDKQPSVAAEPVEKPAAHRWTQRHAPGCDHRDQTKGAAHDAGWEILTHQDRIEGHRSAIRKPKQHRHPVERIEIAG